MISKYKEGFEDACKSGAPEASEVIALRDKHTAALDAYIGAVVEWSWCYGSECGLKAGRRA